jgi:hypothetical protein
MGEPTDDPLRDLDDVREDGPIPDVLGVAWPPPQVGGAFLSGPVPWALLVRAGRLPHKAQSVLLRLCFLAGCRKSRCVPFRLGEMAEQGVGEQSARRSLGALERAGLIRVDRPPGKKMMVTLVWPLPPTDGGSRGPHE